MDMGNSGSGATGFDAHEWSAEFGLVLSIAEALRNELGADIDAHPGGIGCEAGVANRAFRTMARVILGSAVPMGDDPSAVLMWTLRQVAWLRLAELGVVGDRAETLLDMEPGLGDAWLAYVALAPSSVVSDMLATGPDRRGPEPSPDASC
jgi:hypothetical protein